MLDAESLIIDLKQKFVSIYIEIYII